MGANYRADINHFLYIYTVYIYIYIFFFIINLSFHMHAEHELFQSKLVRRHVLDKHGLSQCHNVKYCSRGRDFIFGFKNPSTSPSYCS